MSAPISKDTNDIFSKLHKIEKESEKYVMKRVPKKGVLSLGRKKTIINNENELRVAKLAFVLKICSKLLPHALDTPEQKKEVREILGRIAKNLKTTESALIGRQKPSSKQKARLKDYGKLIAKGE